MGKNKNQSNNKKHTVVEKGSKPKSRLSELQMNMKRKLEGAKFRMLNEQLYTSRGEEAFASFQAEPELFTVYHTGFREQVEKWPVNPLDLIINSIKKTPKAVVADFGCGDARLAKSVAKNKVYSFDLVSVDPDVVTACDIAKVPLEDESIDIAVYCLALMGINVSDYLTECRRVLKPRGIVKIAEVKSRFEIPEIGGINGFIGKMKQFGFDLISKNDKNKMFVLFDFKKSKRGIDQALPFTFKACEYKRR